MQEPIYQDGMRLPQRYLAAPGLEGVYFLQAVHGAGWIARTYFVVSPAGNVLVSPLLYSEALGDFVEEHGGLASIFVTHRDEIERAVLSEVGREGPGQPPERIPACEYRQRFGCSLHVHEADASVLKACQVDHCWAHDTRPSPGQEFIHTPGHTPGSASLILETPAGRLLFCGDLIALDEKGSISTEIEPQEVAGLPLMLNSWSKLIAHPFDALIPLHTYAESPRPYIPEGGREALRKAHAEVRAWLDHYQE